MQRMYLCGLIEKFVLPLEEPIPEQPQEAPR